MSRYQEVKSRAEAEKDGRELDRLFLMMMVDKQPTHGNDGCPRFRY